MDFCDECNGLAKDNDFFYLAEPGYGPYYQFCSWKCLKNFAEKKEKETCTTK